MFDGSRIPDRRVNSMVNRRAYELAMQMIPSIKAYLLGRVKFEQQCAIDSGESGIFREQFVQDALSDSSVEEAIYDIRSSL